MALNAIQENGLKAALEILVQAFKYELAAQGHKDTGELLNSFNSTLKVTENGAEGLIYMLHYGKAMETGRGKGKRGVPIANLMDWIISKGIESDIKKVKGMAFAIRKTIINEGSPTKGSLSLHSPKTDFISLALNQKQDEIFKILEAELYKGFNFTIENLVKEEQIKFANL